VHYRCEFKVVGRVVFLVFPQLSGGIHNFAILHQHTTQALTRSITIDYEVLPDVRKSKDWSSSESGLELLKAGFALG
jgi:hypothetical protein